jgi:hypothetical protein
MIERRHGARFALEALAELLGGNFDGHVPPEPRIVSAIHFTHSTRAHQDTDFVGPEALTCAQPHVN